MKRNYKILIITLISIFIIASLAIIIGCVTTDSQNAFSANSEENATEKCGHDSYHKSFVYYNDYDHLINYICNDCGCVFDSGSEEHAFWDVENSCASSTCNLCDYTCDHEFEYRYSTTGGPCIKCGDYCCSHEYTKWVGGAVNTIVCQDCGKAN